MFFASTPQGVSTVLGLNRGEEGGVHQPPNARICFGARSLKFHLVELPLLNDHGHLMGVIRAILA